MANRIHYRRDTAANWAAANRSSHSGRPAGNPTASAAKVGDGTTPWASLPYQHDATAAAAGYAVKRGNGMSCRATRSLITTSPSLVRDAVASGVRLLHQRQPAAKSAL